MVVAVMAILFTALTQPDRSSRADVPQGNGGATVLNLSVAAATPA